MQILNRILNLFQWMGQYDPKVCINLYTIYAKHKDHKDTSTKIFSDYLYLILKLRYCRLKFSTHHHCVNDLFKDEK